MLTNSSNLTHFRRLFHLLVTLGVMSSLFFIHVPVVRAGDVGGPIDSNTTWTLAGSPYIVTTPVLVMEGVTLTIDPGVEVRFNSHKAFQVDGELLALGTAENPITFTSNVGAVPGAWDYIVFTDSSVDAVYDIDGNYQSGSILQYVIIEYAGGASVDNNGALRLNTAAPFISHATVRHNASHGIFSFQMPNHLKIMDSIVDDNAGSGIRCEGNGRFDIIGNTVTNNTSSEGYYSGGGGIYMQGTTSLIDGNIVRGNASYGQGSGILAGGNSTVTNNYVSENSFISCSPCWEYAAIFSGLHTSTVTISHNVVFNNASAGIRAEGVFSPWADITENIVFQNDGVGITMMSPGTIIRNIVSDNSTMMDGAGIIFVAGGVNFLHNSIIRNSAANNAAIKNDGYDSNVIHANTITGNTNATPLNTQAIRVNGNPLTMSNNNIYSNTGYALYNLTAQGSANVNAENNWWGTASSPAIQAMIYDWFDEPTLGIVDFSPYLTSHYLDAPISPPTGFTVASGLTSLALNWNANPESDVIGYRVYYDTDSLYPYSGTGADQGASPIDVGNAQSLTLTGLPPGIYHVAVTAYDAGVDGSDDQIDGFESWFSLDQTGTVGELPHAEFSAVPTSGIAPLEVAFTNESTGLYSTCAWNFGDASTSSNCANPTHTYSAAGVYTTTLTVDGALGPNTRTRTDYITVYSPAQADFSADPTSGIAPLEVNFTNLSSGDFDTCAWNFGDGGTSDLCAAPPHTYTTGGAVTVTLTISGAGGSDTLAQTNLIHIYTPVHADFSAAPVGGLAPLEVDFTNLSTGDFDTCDWNFGDGGTSDNCTDPTHTYSSAGAYTVVLTVSGPGGTDTRTQTSFITIYVPVHANFSAEPTSGLAPLPVSFTNLSSGDFDTCEWDFGDGSSVETCGTPAHLYVSGGIYTVTLTVSGPGGTDTKILANGISVQGETLLFIPLIQRRVP